MDAHSRKTNTEDEDSLSVKGEDQSSVDKGENWLTKLSPKNGMFYFLAIKKIWIVYNESSD